MNTDSCNLFNSNRSIPAEPAFFTERRHSERSGLGLTGSYETPRIAQAEVRPKCANSILLRAQENPTSHYKKKWRMQQSFQMQKRSLQKKKPFPACANTWLELNSSPHGGLGVARDTARARRRRRTVLGSSLDRPIQACLRSNRRADEDKRCLP